MDGAAVRIAMTSAGLESGPAVLETVISEAEISDGYGERAVTLQHQAAESLNSDLTIGVDAQNTVALKANGDIAIQGMNPLGLGFRLGEDELLTMKINPSHLPSNLKPYLIGRDLVQRPERMFAVADLAAIAETTLPVAKIASTGRLTNSAASAGSLSY